jgi:hypothetical protein
MNYSKFTGRLLFAIVSRSCQGVEAICGDPKPWLLCNLAWNGSYEEDGDNNHRRPTGCTLGAGHGRHLKITPAPGQSPRVRMGLGASAGVGK